MDKQQSRPLTAYDFLAALPEQATEEGTIWILTSIRDELQQMPKDAPFYPTQKWLKNRVTQFCRRGKKGLKSDSTRRRVEKAMNEIWKSWKRNSLVEQDPEIKIPHQHDRVAVFNPGKLRYSLADSQRLLEYVVSWVCGREESLIYPARDGSDGFPTKQQENLLRLLLVLGGVCRYNPLEVINEMVWGDLDIDDRMPIQVPNPGRNGYIWFHLIYLPKLISYCTWFRNGRVAVNQKMFSSTNKDFTDFLKQISNGARVNPPTLNDLVEFCRFQATFTVRQNRGLAVIEGIIPHEPVVRNQARKILGIDERKILKVVYKPVASTEPEIVSNAIEVSDHVNDEGWNEEIAEKWEITSRSIFNNYLQAYWDEPNKANREKLSNCFKNEPPSTNTVENTWYWLTHWVLWMETKKCPKEHSSRLAYFYDAMRTLRMVPHLQVENIDQRVIQEFLDCPDYSPDSKRGAKTALSSFVNFLMEKGKAVLDIPWSKLHVHRDIHPASVFTDEMIEVLKQQGLNPHLETFLDWGLHAGTRSSEACKIKEEHIEREGLVPFVAINRSKRGKSRLARIIGKQPKMCLGDAEIPVDSKKMSSLFGKAISHIINDEDVRVNYHKLRAKYLSKIAKDFGHLAASKAGGHASALTLPEYDHLVDLQTVEDMAQWDYILNKDFHIPLGTFAALLGYSIPGIKNLINAYLEEFPKKPIHLVPGTDSRLMDELPFIHRHDKAEFLLISDAISLVQWAIVAERYEKRGRAQKYSGQQSTDQK